MIRQERKRLLIQLAQDFFFLSTVIVVPLLSLLVYLPLLTIFTK